MKTRAFATAGIVSMLATACGPAFEVGEQGSGGNSPGGQGGSETAIGAQGGGAGSGGSKFHVDAGGGGGVDGSVVPSEGGTACSAYDQTSCEVCAANACCAERSACESDPICVDFAACANGCWLYSPDPDDFAICLEETCADSMASKDTYISYLTCLDGACAYECGGSPT